VLGLTVLALTSVIIAGLGEFGGSRHRSFKTGPA